MFSNLSKGNILYGIDRKGGMTWFTGSVERVIPSMTKQYSNLYGQFPTLNLDIVATINGEQKEFKQVHGNDTIADFGPNAFVIADNKDSLYNYVKSLLKTSEDIVNSVETHKALIPQYKNVLNELMPGTTNNAEVKELKEQVGSLQSKLEDVLSLLKSGTQTKN